MSKGFGIFFAKNYAVSLKTACFRALHAIFTTRFCIACALPAVACAKSGAHGFAAGNAIGTNMGRHLGRFAQLPVPQCFAWNWKRWCKFLFFNGLQAAKKGLM